MADTNITITTAGGVRLKTEGNYVDTDIVVAPDSTSQANLIPENIRSGVSILDVDGTLNPQDGLSMYTTTATLVTTGTGTVAASAINIPTDHTLQVNDLLMDTEGTVGQVTATGDPVSYSFYASLKGATGATGPQGIAGLSLFRCNAVLGTSGSGAVANSNIVVPDGRSIEVGSMILDVNGTIGLIVDTTTGSSNYVYFTSIKGAKGDTGETGPRGEQGPQGATGAAGVGVPSGGTTGQVLKKASNTNYDTEWADESGGIESSTGGDTNFSTVSNIVTTTLDSPDASSLPEGTLVIKIAS